VIDKAVWKKWCLIAIKLLVVAIVFLFVQKTIFSGLEDLREHPLRVRPGWLVASGVVYLFGLLPAALFWWRVLRVLGQEAGLLESLRAYYISHLGKYVPGKAMVVVLRTGLIRGHRVDTSVAAASVFFETLLMMSVGAFWAAGVLAFWYREETYLCMLSIGLMLAVGVPILPPFFWRLAMLAGVGRSNPEVAAKVRAWPWRTLFEGFVAMSACWAMLGVSLWAALQATQPEPVALVALFPLYLACVALAMVAGFLSLIPGGVGIREMVLTQLLGRPFSNAVAVTAAVLLRLAWLAAELAASGILYFVSRKGADIRSEDRLE